VPHKIKHDPVQMPGIRRTSGRCATSGFTLIELMIVVAIVAIIAAIAYPSYIDQITKTKRASATACLSEYANYMERYHTTNLRYDQDSGGTANALPALDCASADQTGTDYTYSFTNAQPTPSTYVIQAVPQGSQNSRDTRCKTLTLDQAGQRGIVGGTATAGDCW
jgi:type IV pilus assembly protein PilE